MNRCFVVLLVVFSLAQSALAWGPAVHESLCKKAVSETWGSEGLNCLGAGNDLCKGLQNAGLEEDAKTCFEQAKTADVNGFNYAKTVSKDEENFKNLDACPLEFMRTSKEFICAGSGNPAGQKAQTLFDAAAREGKLCQKVQLFCLAGSYLAESRYKLNRVSHLTGCFGEDTEKLIDGFVSSGKNVWELSQQCVFTYDKPMAGVTKKTSQHLSFNFDSGELDAISQMLSAKAKEVKRGKQEMEKPQKQVTTTSLEKTTTTTYVVSTTTTTTPPKQDKKLDKIMKKIGGIEDILDDILSKRIKDSQGAVRESSMMFLASIVLIGLTLISLTAVFLKYKKASRQDNTRVVIPPSVRRRMKARK